jgi:uncharacterized protein
MAARLFIDPWPPDYDSAVQIDEAEVEAHEADVRVETADWKPIRCETAGSLPLICFVDGIRRIEARVISQASDQIIYGLFGSTGVGTVLCRDGLAEVHDDLLIIKRYLIIGLQQEQSQSLRIGGTDLRFEGIAVPVNDPLSPFQALHNQMRMAEMQLGQSLLSNDSCVFVDGPLSYFTTAKEALVGIIKRIHRLYLPGECRGLLTQLRAGERTPLFLIHDERQRHDRYSCYLRLVEPRKIDHPLAGIVRLEVRAAVDMAKIVSLVNYASCELPRFASSPIRDPRAPQNLVPIGALEDALKRRLGDAILIRRAIEERIAEGVLV